MSSGKSEPIACELYDHLEIACMRGYELEGTMKDGRIWRGRASTLRIEHGVECLILANATQDDNLIPLQQLAEVRTTQTNASFQSLVFD